MVLLSLVDCWSELCKGYFGMGLRENVGLVSTIWSRAYTVLNKHFQAAFDSNCYWTLAVAYCREHNSTSSSHVVLLLLVRISFYRIGNQVRSPVRYGDN